MEIGEFFYQRRRENGDVQDGFDPQDKEANQKPHRIPARTVLCGLWTRLGAVTGEEKYQKAALELAKAAAPEIQAYTFYNQMIDGHIGGSTDEVYDSENACYALEGLVELYQARPSLFLRELCQKCAAYLISWMYFYDLETGYHGVTRGGTTCRMKDLPLVYLGAGGFAFDALKKLALLEKDPFYSRVADEMLECVLAYQCTEEGVPWQYGAIHAMDQNHGLHWGPDREGQMDSGMTSGMAMMNLECLLGEK